MHGLISKLVKLDNTFEEYQETKLVKSLVSFCLHAIRRETLIFSVCERFDSSVVNYTK